VATVVAVVSTRAGAFSTPVVEGSKAALVTRVVVTKAEEGSRVVMASRGEVMRLHAADMGLAVVDTILIKVTLSFLVWEVELTSCKGRVATVGR
jgi:hypothetical protein